jgi:uncharacterized membrane protein (UPF0182 family)
MPWRRFGAPIAVIVLMFALGRISSIVVDWAWFSSIGYPSVFWTVFATKAALFVVVFVVSTLLLLANASLAYRFASRPRLRLPAVFDPGVATFRASQGPWAGSYALQPSPLVWRLIILIIALVLGLLIAMGESGRWDLVLRFLYQAPYGRSDPLFEKDIGFYLFSLPLYVAVKNWLLWVLVLASLMAGSIYFLHDDISLDSPRWSVSPSAIAHGSALIGLFFAIKAWAYALDRYLLLYDDNGVVVGASYADVHVELPALWLLIVLAAVAAIVAWMNVRLRRLPLVVAAAVMAFGGSILFSGIAPALFERFYVKPNELQLERPYLQRNIALTREAYNLGQITVKPFPAEQDLTFQSLKEDSGTVNNIRLWDWQPLLDTYAQLQEIRTYYRFLDVDVDRYHLESYQQVMLSAREVDPSLLAPNAQTWVNLHLLFTHGAGVVMSPVTEKSAEGLPIFYLKDIPPAAAGGPAITEPRIYFGQSMSGFVIVKGSTPEFDYPKGSDNVYARYDGADGVAIGGFAWRSLFAWYFGDVNILLSDYLTSESRIMLHRNISDRAETIAPFLELDRDPYMAVSEGRLYWIQDAYTTSEWFPYAPPSPDGGDINYIRNSVKIVIDAYNGTVSFYVADAADPIVATYRRIFPSLFKPFDAMPPDLQKHIRYPEDLFTIQALEYRAYHMDVPEVFYNREDLWQFPREPVAPDGPSGGGARMAPYYIMMRLPGETRTEFFLMLPMAPSQRENMIAWLAARCDPPKYGKLIVYEFPKEKLVYGPFQIEALINQNTEISQQISLWNQMGSRVIRGNLLVVPIENSILYVSPLYLRAQSGQLPELKRVIAAYGDRVVMEETLPAALAALFKESAPLPALTAPAGPSGAGQADSQAREALADYERAIDRLKAGDWAGFGAELDALRPLLEELSRQPAAH